jgi:hypothetical protein
LGEIRNEPLEEAMCREPGIYLSTYEISPATSP